MDWLATVTFDQVVLSLLSLVLIREALIQFLPDNVAGPGGWLVDTGDN